MTLVQRDPQIRVPCPGERAIEMTILWSFLLPPPAAVSSSHICAYRDVVYPGMESAAARTTTPPQASVVFFLLIIVALQCAATVDAARQLRPADDGRPVVQNQDAAAYATLHERTPRSSSSTVMAWTAQLPAGPSPRGPGH
ncbi:hypothetical protein E2562_018799 [Oryza meyeriana var. granulata]|uniref:Uncharacterized protein n=1 Tax=Oryza meyeriana var. granulata TaxID=110450 RepID=A0A6G1F9N8_9ORYZ|nr:hypothetical protein E2562_018799 [Oryza meyeriana var. granulata]